VLGEEATREEYRRIKRVVIAKENHIAKQKGKGLGQKQGAEEL